MMHLRIVRVGKRWAVRGLINTNSAKVTPNMILLWEPTKKRESPCVSVHIVKEEAWEVGG